MWGWIQLERYGAGCVWGVRGLLGRLGLAGLEGFRPVNLSDEVWEQTGRGSEGLEPAGRVWNGEKTGVVVLSTTALIQIQEPSVIGIRSRASPSPKLPGRPDLSFLGGEWLLTMHSLSPMSVLLELAWWLAGMHARYRLQRS